MAASLASGCNATSGPHRAALPPREPPRAFEDGRWGHVVSSRFSLELDLPERSAWRVDDRSAPWLTARHPPTETELLARSWRAERRVGRGECEAQARLWRPDLPRPDAGSVLDESDLGAPAGYDTRLVVGVDRVAGSAALQGYALAFGADVGRCFAMALATRAEGPRAERVIGERLGLAVDGIFRGVRARAIDERAR